MYLVQVIRTNTFLMMMAVTFAACGDETEVQQRPTETSEMQSTSTGQKATFSLEGVEQAEELYHCTAMRIGDLNLEPTCQVTQNSCTSWWFSLQPKAYEDRSGNCQCICVDR